MLALSLCPATAVPEITGRLVFAGRLEAELTGAVTTAVGFELAEAVPVALVALTATRSVDPLSPLASE